MVLCTYIGVEHRLLGEPPSFNAKSSEREHLFQDIGSYCQKGSISAALGMKPAEVQQEGFGDGQS